LPPLQTARTVPVLNIEAVGDHPAMIQDSISDIEYEIEPPVDSVAAVRYPHQQFALE
jgi:hypothetical protein